MSENFNQYHIMSRNILLLAFLLALAPVAATAQDDKPVPTAADTARAMQIVDRYIGYVDYDRLPHDSMLVAVTTIVEYNHPTDTMTIYRWHAWPNYNRIEMWQHGKMDMGGYTDDKKIFHQYSPQYHDWRNLTRHSFYDFIQPYDLRGPLFKWRSKATEMYYEGEYEYNGHKVDRVFVSMSGQLDRYYFFEQETGLLFLVTEKAHQLEGGIPEIERMVDWRSWQEFTPVGDCLLPSAESYQIRGQLVILHHTYRLEPVSMRPFTEKYMPK